MQDFVHQQYDIKAPHAGAAAAARIGGPRSVSPWLQLCFAFFFWVGGWEGWGWVACGEFDVSILWHSLAVAAHTNSMGDPTTHDGCNGHTEKPSPRGRNLAQSQRSRSVLAIWHLRTAPPMTVGPNIRIQ